MTIVYRTAGAWGPGKGSRLTKAEVDNNFYDVVTRIAILEGSIPAAAIGIASFQLVGTTQFEVILSDSSTQGPFDLPLVDFPYKGVWTPVTPFAKRDTFTNNGSFYEVLVSHTSALTFDPSATDGLGNDLYGLRMTNPGATLPTGGATDFVMYKESGADFDIGWRPSGVPRGGAAFSLLAKASTSDFDSGWLLQSALSIAFTQVTGVAAAAQLPNPAPTTIGGVKSIAAAANNFLTEIGIDGTPLAAQPTFSNISGNLSQTQRRDSTVTPLGASGSVSLDPTLSSIFSMTPTGNVTLNAAGVTAGAVIFVIITTSGTSSWNVTPNSNFKSQGVLATGVVSGKKFVIQFVSDGLFLNEVARTPAM